MRSASLLVALLLLFGGAVSRQPAEAVDWMTLPGTYTHDPITAHRVDRFADPKPSLAPVDPSFRSSGYTHMRSTIQVGESMDSYHRVNQWGTTPVRPYGEWRFPYRPYSAPYPDWGAPFAGFNAWPPGLFPPFPHPGFGGGPGGGPPGAGPPGAGGTGGHWGGPGGGWGGPGGYPPGQPINPYPIDPRGPYPAPPWFDGSYPSLPFRPYLNDRQFFFNPSQSLPGN